MHIRYGYLPVVFNVYSRQQISVDQCFKRVVLQYCNVRFRILRCFHGIDVMAVKPRTNLTELHIGICQLSSFFNQPNGLIFCFRL